MFERFSRYSFFKSSVSSLFMNMNKLPCAPPFLSLSFRLSCSLFNDCSSVTRVFSIYHSSLFSLTIYRVLSVAGNESYNEL
jgi:hypothetical protein